MNTTDDTTVTDPTTINLADFLDEGQVLADLGDVEYVTLPMPPGGLLPEGRIPHENPKAIRITINTDLGSTIVKVILTGRICDFVAGTFGAIDDFQKHANAAVEAARTDMLDNRLRVGRDGGDLHLREPCGEPVILESFSMGDSNYGYMHLMWGFHPGSNIDHSMARAGIASHLLPDMSKIFIEQLLKMSNADALSIANKRRTDLARAQMGETNTAPVKVDGDLDFESAERIRQMGSMDNIDRT